MANDKKTTKKRDVILGKLGVFGWEGTPSLLLFTAFLSGGTPCLIGTHGTGKTMAAKRLAKALGLTSGLWDTSKATEEILGGMFDIEKLKEGVVRYVDDPLSGAVWGKEIGIFDELTRANPAIQNLLLELFRNKTFNGLQTDMKLCIATANDLSYSNTEPLDLAFASRIALTIRVPEIYQMDDKLRETIIDNSELCDNLMLKHWDSSFEIAEDRIPWVEVKKDVVQYFTDGIKRYKEIDATYREDLIVYVDTAMQVMHKKAGHGSKNAVPEASLDGRRGGLILRNLIAGLAIEHIEGTLDTRELQNTVERIWANSFTFDLTGSKIDRKAIEEAHATAQQYIQKKNIVTIEIMKEKNPFRQLMLSIFLHDQDPLALLDLCEKFFTDAFDDDVKMTVDQREELQMQSYLLAIADRNKTSPLFRSFDGKAEYEDITTRIAKIKKDVTAKVAEGLDNELVALRRQTKPSKQKKIQEFLDRKFAESMGMDYQSALAHIQSINAIKDKDAREAALVQIREQTEPWIIACQILHLTLKGTTFKKEPEYIQNLFCKALDNVNAALDIIRADYATVRKDILARQR